VADRGVGLQALASGLVQPDETTCGSSVLVAARMLDHPAYAATLVNGSGDPLAGAAAGTLQERFRQQALEMHRLTGGFTDSSGGRQIPWPAALGTQPWALAREMTLAAGEKGMPYAVQPILPSRRGRVFDGMAWLAGAGHPVPLYVGNRWSPRHVVLVLPCDVDPRPAFPVNVYDPASGRCYPLARTDFTAARLDVAGWRVPWVAVVPSAH
jgi:hypothetical protein